MKQENDVVLADMLLCAAGWHVDACLIGNVTAGQIRAFCLSVSDYKARIAELEGIIRQMVNFEVRPERDTPLTRDPDVTVEARLKVDPAFAVALYHEQRKQIAELEEQAQRLKDFSGVSCDIAKAQGGDA